MQDIPRRLRQLAELAESQLFFVGGAPRSGTTWLQEILHVHPQVSCRGEGLFLQQLARPIDALMAARGATIAEKNTNIFRHGPGYPLPAADDADALVAAGILMALQSQLDGRHVRAVGEKTPENAFFFPRLARLFPRAKFIAIARDPRDVIASAWHFFPRPKPTDAADEIARKTAFIELSLPSLLDGTRAILAFGEQHPKDLLIVTYEALRATPTPVVRRLCEFLLVAADDATVEACVARTSFEAMTRGRSAGTTVDGSFFRGGVAGSWPQTLTPAMSERIVEAFAGTFATFGWRP